MNMEIIQQDTTSKQLIVTNREASINSLEIANLVEKRHDNVKRTVESLVKQGVIARPQFEEVENKNSLSNNKVAGAYVFSGEQGKRDSIIVVAQLSPEFTARLVDRWYELEKQQNVGALPDFSNPAEAARAWAEQYEANILTSQQLAIAAPKAEFVDKYVDGTGSKGFRQVAKLLNIKEPEFRFFLQEEQIMYRLGGEWMPYANHIEAGRFEVKTGQADNGHAFNTAKFTPKGIEWIAGKWAQHQIKESEV